MRYMIIYQSCCKSKKETTGNKISKEKKFISKKYFEKNKKVVDKSEKIW